MQHEPNVSTTDNMKAQLRESADSVQQSVASASGAICKETCDICESASEGIRKNPIASVVGAAVFGAAVCYLILEGRSQATLSERYITKPLSNAADSASNSIDSIINSLKFW